jgi:hypothetical protein
MTDKPIMTRPINDEEKTLRQKFFESFAAQSDLMDKMSERLITLELAIPGIYATILKLLGGDDAVVVRNVWFYLTFGFWALALIFTLIALIPRKYQVDTNLLRKDPSSTSKILGIEDFFSSSAQFKLVLIILSSIFFFLGTFCIVFTIG